MFGSVLYTKYVTTQVHGLRTFGGLMGSRFTVHGWKVMKIESRLGGKDIESWSSALARKSRANQNPPQSPFRKGGSKIPLGPPLEKGEDSGSPLL